MVYCSFFTNHKDRKKRELQHSVAHSLLTHGLLLEHGISYENVRIVNHNNGKPFIEEYPDIQFNLSHCNGGAACIIDSVPVGIDIENVRNFEWRTAKRVCTEKELQYIGNSADQNKAFFTLWTLKESAVKTSGIGIRTPLTDFEFTFTDGKICCNHKEFGFESFEQEGFIISFCKLINT